VLQVNANQPRSVPNMTFYIAKMGLSIDESQLKPITPDRVMARLGQ
jgi:hypothetical protein